MSLKFLKTYLQLTDHIARYVVLELIGGDWGEDVTSVFCFDFHLNII